MALDDFFQSDEPSSDDIKAKIRQRRSQMLVHSCLYYEMNASVVDDHTWQKWADELDTIQKENPDCCKIGFYDFDFMDWTGATGNHLPLLDPWVTGQAERLLKYREEHVNGIYN